MKTRIIGEKRGGSPFSKNGRIPAMVGDSMEGMPSADQMAAGWCCCCCCWCHCSSATMEFDNATMS